MMQLTVGTVQSSRDPVRENEQGWALLGLLLALGVMSIVLASSIIPNVQMQVQRDKEVEMIYRGEQASEGIARYYNGGRLGPIQLFTPPPYGYLKELEKLRDGVTIGVNERKFVRASALIDPISNSEWEPVRARDPRIAKFLQAWAAQTLIPIPSQYLLLASAPTKSVFAKMNPSSSDPQPGGGDSGQPPVVNPANPGAPQIKPPVKVKPDPDDDDDDDDEPNDPLARLFPSDGSSTSDAPIVGVAPKRKGKAANAYYGLEYFEEWVFLFIPKNLPQNQGIPNRNGSPSQNQRPQISN